MPPPWNPYFSPKPITNALLKNVGSVFNLSRQACAGTSAPEAVPALALPKQFINMSTSPTAKRSKHKPRTIEVVTRETMPLSSVLHEGGRMEIILREAKKHKHFIETASHLLDNELSPGVKRRIAHLRNKPEVRPELDYPLTLKQHAGNLELDHWTLQQKNLRYFVDSAKPRIRSHLGRHVQHIRDLLAKRHHDRISSVVGAHSGSKNDRARIAREKKMGAIGSGNRLLDVPAREMKPPRSAIKVVRQRRRGDARDRRRDAERRDRSSSSRAARAPPADRDRRRADQDDFSAYEDLVEQITKDLADRRVWTPSPKRGQGPQGGTPPSPMRRERPASATANKYRLSDASATDSDVVADDRRPSTAGSMRRRANWRPNKTKHHPHRRGGKARGRQRNAKPSRAAAASSNAATKGRRKAKATKAKAKGKGKDTKKKKGAAFVDTNEFGRFEAAMLDFDPPALPPGSVAVDSASASSDDDVRPRRTTSGLRGLQAGGGVPKLNFAHVHSDIAVQEARAAALQRQQRRQQLAQRGGESDRWSNFEDSMLGFAP